jgi:hypothetical protein
MIKKLYLKEAVFEDEDKNVFGSRIKVQILDSKVNDDNEVVLLLCLINYRIFREFNIGDKRKPQGYQGILTCQYIGYEFRHQFIFYDYRPSIIPEDWEQYAISEFQEREMNNLTINFSDSTCHLNIGFTVKTKLTVKELQSIIEEFEPLNYATMPILIDMLIEKHECQLYPRDSHYKTGISVRKGIM